MKRVLIAISIGLLYLPINIFAQAKNPPIPYIAPVDVPLSLTGNFAELRSNHFHSGIDFSTHGKQGCPVYATADGYVSRIKVSPYGFGKAIYINHPNGTSSVYAHLKSFISPISDFVKVAQYNRESFSLDTIIQAELFQFSQGDIIAMSGNSGSSGGPHLHFEIRDTKSERPQNPLKYIPGIKDDMNPPIVAIYLYPLSENSHVNAKKERLRRETVYYNNRYHLKKNKSIKVFGNIGIGVQALDYLNASWSKCGIYESKLIINKDTIFSFSLNSFSFAQSRYLNAHVDYEEKLKNKHWVHKLYKLPGNKLDIYNQTLNNGVFNFENDSIYKIEVLVSDAYGNVSKVDFKLEGDELLQPPVTDYFYSRLFIYSRENFFEADNLKLKMTDNSLYEDLKFVYDCGQKPEGCFSDIHHVHNIYTPVHKTFSLAVKPDSLPDSLTTKALIVAIDGENGAKSSAGGSYKDGWVHTRIRNFGSFAVSVDTIPPSIKPLSISKGKVLTEKGRIRFKIHDDLSGIKSYRVEIDGKWILFEYDAKSNLIYYNFDDDKIKKGGKHILNLIVEDYKENKTEYNAMFFW
jgi:hypothetical protein